MKIIYIGENKILKISEHLKNHYPNQLPNWQKLYPLANIIEASETFLLKNAFETFNDELHFRNSFAKHLKNMQNEASFQKEKDDGKVHVRQHIN
ncbi:MAG: hypothetical protein ACFFDN_25095 [Candidatus Hodarchaeota archaeon]